ncbi:hypothetical protein FRB97_000668, partial [Tulasnella sp. 331]
MVEYLRDRINRKNSRSIDTLRELGQLDGNIGWLRGHFADLIMTQDDSAPKEWKFWGRYLGAGGSLLGFLAVSAITAGI